jgi:hypothetical protein
MWFSVGMCFLGSQLSWLLETAHFFRPPSTYDDAQYLTVFSGFPYLLTTLYFSAAFHRSVKEISLIQKPL